MLDKVKQEIHRSRGTSQHELILRLNPILKGWANYYLYSAASETFRKADHLIFKKLWRWGIRRHGNKNRTWIKQRYFHKIGNRDCICYYENRLKGRRIFSSSDDMEEMAVLCVIENNPRITQTEITEAIKKTVSTIKRITSALVEKGIITRRNGSRNGWWEIIHQ